jgi:transposase
MAKLFRTEKVLRALELSDEEFVARRRKEVEPILTDFLPWLQSKALQVPPSSLLGKAVNYTLGQWEKLVRYLEQAFLTPDTNRVENAVRPFVTGRNYVQPTIMLS